MSLVYLIRRAWLREAESGPFPLSDFLRIGSWFSLFIESYYNQFINTFYYLFEGDLLNTVGFTEEFITASTQLIFLNIICCNIS